MKIFKNREAAARLLAYELKQYQNLDSVKLAVPRGGVPIGKSIAEQLDLPLEVVLTKKIGHPFQKEYAIGAVSLESRIINDSVDVSEKYIEEETQRIRELLRQRYQLFHRGRKPVSLVDKIVIIVDDGIATGHTILSAVELVQQHHPRKVVVAVPVAPPDTVQRMKSSQNIDEFICLLEPIHFNAVGQYYQDFRQIPDTEVIDLLATFYGKSAPNATSDNRESGSN